MMIPRLMLALTLSALPQAVGAQASLPAATAADSALAACLSAAGPGSTMSSPDREAANGHAERLWRAEVARNLAGAPPRVGLARVLVQCRLPMATGPADMMGLFQEAVDALQYALEREPGYWRARYTLGLVFAGAPEFLGQTSAAIAQLERVSGPEGIPADRPELIDALNELARLYDRAGRTADAAAARTRAAALRSAVPAAQPRQGRAGFPPPPDSVTRVTGITVTAASPVSDVAGNRGGRAVTALDIVTMPGGAADLMQALQVLPGVTGGSESSDLSLRGGDPYEAPVFLNGARLAYAGKFESLSGSLFGVLDPDVLRSARVYPGGFSVRHGDALSGVIEAESVGRPAARSRRYALNTAGPAATLMAPLGEHAGAWASARLTNTGLILRMQGRSDAYASNPLSLEGIAGLTRRGGAGEVRAVALIEHDAASPYLTIAGHTGAYRSTGTTVATVLAARLGRVGPLAALRLKGALSSRTSGAGFGALDFQRRLVRGELRADGDMIAGGTLVRGGVELSRVEETLDGTVPTTGRFAPGEPVASLADVHRSADHLGAFVEAVILPAGWLVVTPGLRVDRLPGERGVTADPRLAAEASFGAWTASAAGGVFQQGRFRPTREQPGLDERTGVARSAVHLVLGLERRGAVTVRGDAWVKRYDRWINGEAALTPASGSVMGGDVFVNVPGQRRSAHVTWSVMRGRLTLPGGARIPTAHDVTHSLVIVGAQRFGSAWEVGVTARLATGRPYTALLSRDTTGGSGAVALGAPNGDRYPTYRRLDARISRYSRLGSHLVVAFAELLNLEGRGNVVGYGVQSTAGRSEPITTFYGRRTVIVGVEVR